MLYYTQWSFCQACFIKVVGHRKRPPQRVPKRGENCKCELHHLFCYNTCIERSMSQTIRTTFAAFPKYTFFDVILRHRQPYFDIRQKYELVPSYLDSAVATLWQNGSDLSSAKVWLMQARQYTSTLGVGCVFGVQAIRCRRDSAPKKDSC